MTASVTDTQLDDWRDLGSAIRERRRAKSLTLVDLASQVGLSQPFLSQIENGRARPSLMSLQRIAEALGTTPQAFFGGVMAAGAGPVLVRAADVRTIDVGTDDESMCRVLLAGDASFHLVEFDGLPTEFLGSFSHDGFEATYVIAGSVEIDIDGVVTALRAGDSISYAATLPHRLRSTGKRRAKVLLIETKIATIQDPGPGNHAPLRAVRRKRRPATVSRRG